MQVAQTCSLYAFFWKENKNVTIVCAFVPFDQLMGNKMFPSLQSVNLVHNAISSQCLCILSQMEVRDGLLYFTNINKINIHYTSTVITHSQAQSLPLKCHRLTAPNCWVHKVHTSCTHFQKDCPFPSMHKVVYKYYIGCSVCLKFALKDLGACNNLGMGLFTHSPSITLCRF